MPALAFVLMLASSLRSSAEEPRELVVSGRVLIPSGVAKCVSRAGCWCEFSMRRVGERCRVGEARDDRPIGEDFSPHQEDVQLVDAGGRAFACGVRLRCNLRPPADCRSVVFVLSDGGLAPLDGGACED